MKRLRSMICLLLLLVLTSCIIWQPAAAGGSIPSYSAWQGVERSTGETPRKQPLPLCLIWFLPSSGKVGARLAKFLSYVNEAQNLRARKKLAEGLKAAQVTPQRPRPP